MTAPQITAQAIWSFGERGLFSLLEEQPVFCFFFKLDYSLSLHAVVPRSQVPGKMIMIMPGEGRGRVGVNSDRNRKYPNREGGGAFSETTGDRGPEASPGAPSGRAPRGSATAPPTVCTSDLGVPRFTS